MEEKKEIKSRAISWIQMKMLRRMMKEFSGMALYLDCEPTKCRVNLRVLEGNPPQPELTIDTIVNQKSMLITDMLKDLKDQNPEGYEIFLEFCSLLRDLAQNFFKTDLANVHMQVWTDDKDMSIRAHVKPISGFPEWEKVELKGE